jgi:hypothetical protein
MVEDPRAGVGPPAPATARRLQPDLSRLQHSNQGLRQALLKFAAERLSAH